MFSLGGILAEALGLILSWDRDLGEIVALSLRVTLSAVAIACLIGLPLGAVIGACRFPGRGALTVLLNTLMGLPPVVVGLFVYLILSASGPLGVLGLLYTPAAMIVAALTKQVVEDLHDEYAKQFASFGLTLRARVTERGPIDRVLGAPRSEAARAWVEGRLYTGAPYA